MWSVVAEALQFIFGVAMIVGGLCPFVFVLPKAYRIKETVAVLYMAYGAIGITLGAILCLQVVT